MPRTIGRSESINCPHCGELIEAAKPNAVGPGKRPKVDKAERNLFLAHKYGSFPCPKCRKGIVVRWE